MGSSSLCFVCLLFACREAWRWQTGEAFLLCFRSNAQYPGIREGTCGEHLCGMIMLDLRIPFVVMSSWMSTLSHALSRHIFPLSFPFLGWTERRHTSIHIYPSTLARLLVRHAFLWRRLR